MIVMVESLPAASRSVGARAVRLAKHGRGAREGQRARMRRRWVRAYRSKLYTSRGCPMSWTLSGFGPDDSRGWARAKWMRRGPPAVLMATFEGLARVREEAEA